MSAVTPKSVLTTPLTRNNPIALQVLGICSALAVTISMSVSLVMTLAVIFVCAFSNLFVDELQVVLRRGRLNALVESIIGALYLA